MVLFPNLRIIRDTSEGSLPLFPDFYFDFVFIDSLHDYESCLKDIHIWMPKVAKGKILGGHDYSHGGHPGVTKAVQKAFPLEKIRQEKGKVWWTIV